jgi:superfamily II DNA/RNA helicase
VSFAQLNLSPDLLHAAQRMGYTRPTPIQHEAIPLLLDGRDLLASAATGNAYTLVAPEDEVGLRAIERGIGQRIPRKTLTGFNYRQKSEGRFEVPLAERIAIVRARKIEERSRSKSQRRSNEAKRVGRGNVPAGLKREPTASRHARVGPSSRRSRPAVNRPPSRSRDNRT